MTILTCCRSHTCAMSMTMQFIPLVVIFLGNSKPKRSQLKSRSLVKRRNALWKVLLHCSFQYTCNIYWYIQTNFYLFFIISTLLDLCHVVKIWFWCEGFQEALCFASRVFIHSLFPSFLCILLSNVSAAQILKSNFERERQTAISHKTLFFYYNDAGLWWLKERLGKCKYDA